MTERMQIDAPKVVDIGSPDEVVDTLKVALVGGRVDIVTHDDSPTARLEVHDVGGRPLQVTWTGSTLRITHVKEKDGKFWEDFLHVTRGDSTLTARISVSVPEQADITVSTVSAEAVVNGVRATVKGNTVTGTLTLDDISGNVKANTVSGAIECHGLSGDLNGNTVSGPITVLASTLPHVRLNTVSGDITMDLRNGEADISSNSVSGDVTVRVPAGHGYDVTAHTASGDVVIDGTSMRKDHGQRGGQLRDGDGALVIRGNSVSGNVVVLRAGDRVAPQDVPRDVPLDVPHDIPHGIPHDIPHDIQDTVPSTVPDGTGEHGDDDGGSRQDTLREEPVPSVPPTQPPAPPEPMRSAPPVPPTPPAQPSSPWQNEV